MFPAQFDEIVDEDAILESGAGEVIKVEVGRCKDGGTNERRGVIFYGDSSEGFSGVRGI